MNGSVIPFFGLKRQYENLKDELLDITDNVLRSGQFIEGFYTKELENYLGERVGAYAAICHSGTQALEIVATYLRQGFSNPTVAIPNLTYPATANAFILNGYELYLIDTNEFGIINTEKIPKNIDITVIVGLYGRDPNFSSRSIETKHVVVDGAQHWLCLTKKSNLGFATTVSFDPTKNLNSSGNGGAILSTDYEFIDFVINYRSNGKPLFKNPGTNSKMSEIDCAHVIIRSKYIDEWQIKRKKIAGYWNDQFKNLPVKSLCDLSVPNAVQKYVIYTENRNALRTHLTTSNIETRISYDKTLNEMPAYKEYNNPSYFSTSYMLSKGVLSLPIYPELYDNEIEYVADTIKSFFKNNS